MVKEKIKNLAPGAFFNAGPAVVTVLEHFADGRTLLAAKEPIGTAPSPSGRSPTTARTRSRTRTTSRFLPFATT
jgi:hypothetical protein